MGLPAGKTKLRRIIRWSKRHLAELQRHLPFPNGVPSVSTMSRMLAAVDEEMVALALTNWIGEIYNTRGGGSIPDMIDNVCDHLEIGLQMIFSPIPGQY